MRLGHALRCSVLVSAARAVDHDLRTDQFAGRHRAPVFRLCPCPRSGSWNSSFASGTSFGSESSTLIVGMSARSTWIVRCPEVTVRLLSSHEAILPVILVFGPPAAALCLAAALPRPWAWDHRRAPSRSLSESASGFGACDPTAADARIGSAWSFAPPFFVPATHPRLRETIVNSSTLSATFSSLALSAAFSSLTIWPLNSMSLARCAGNRAWPCRGS